MYKNFKNDNEIILKEKNKSLKTNLKLVKNLGKNLIKNIIKKSRKINNPKI